MKLTKDRHTGEIKLTFRGRYEYDEYIKTELKEHVTGYERVENQKYYFATASGKVDYDKDCSDYIDVDRYRSANYFSSGELAELVVKADNLMRRIRRRISEICKPVNWGNLEETKYTIVYDYDSQELKVQSVRLNRVLFGLWCDTEENAKRIIAEYGADLIWYSTEYRERMDTLIPVPDENEEKSEDVDWLCVQREAI